MPHTQWAWAHTHTHTHTHAVSFTSSGVSQIWQSKCLLRPKMTGVQDRGSDAETRPPGFTHCCPSHWQPAQQLQHFSTSAPIWPPLNITVVYWYDVQADYIMSNLMLVIFTDIHLSSKVVLMCCHEWLTSRQCFHGRAEQEMSIWNEPVRRPTAEVQLLKDLAWSQNTITDKLEPQNKLYL